MSKKGAFAVQSRVPCNRAIWLPRDVRSKICGPAPNIPASTSTNLQVCETPPVLLHSSHLSPIWVSFFLRLIAPGLQQRFAACLAAERWRSNQEDACGAWPKRLTARSPRRKGFRNWLTARSAEQTFLGSSTSYVFQKLSYLITFAREDGFFCRIKCQRRKRRRLVHQSSVQGYDFWLLN
jgi:hypothetical protein